jgi:DNA repair exonuclease SbcCD nuclease subunit
VVFETIKAIGDELKGETDQVVILGDITHEHGRLTPPVLLAVDDALYNFNYHGMAVTLIDGNHDLDANNCSILDAFIDNEESTRIEAHHVPSRIFWSYPVAVHVIPYCSAEETKLAFKEIEQAAKEYPDQYAPGCVVLMHGHFDGAKHGNHEFQPPGGISPKDIPDCVQLVISGHYHMFQEIDDRILYIGAPLQHDFGEAQYVPGYMVLDFAENGEVTWERVDVDFAPVHHILPHNLDLEDIPGRRSYDYYRIDLPSDVDPSEITDLYEAVQNVIVKPLPIDADMRSRVEKHLEKKGEKVEFVDVMEAYVAMHAEPKMADRLEELGADIMSTVLGEE